MKKQLLFLTAGTLLAFASCNNETPAASGPSQEQIDSMVNARVEEMRTQLMAENDSLINALAQWKADSMIAAMKGAKPAAAKPVAKAKPAPKPVEQAPVNVQKPATVGNGKPRMDDKSGDPNSVGNGKPRMDDKKNNDNTIGTGKPKMH